jgi:hypothetical protein
VHPRRAEWFVNGRYCQMTALLGNPVARKPEGAAYQQNNGEDFERQDEVGLERQGTGRMGGREVVLAGFGFGIHVFRDLHLGECVFVHWRAARRAEMLALQGCSRRLDEEASGRFEGWRHKRFGRAGSWDVEVRIAEEATGGVKIVTPWVRFAVSSRRSL